jgi:polar amino acid transport system permease protein
LLTLRLSAETMLLGLLLGVLGAWAKTYPYRLARGIVQAYVELIRNTPFLVQLLLIYLGLPRLGVRFSADSAALLAMMVNLGAYATEIVRAGIEAVPHGQIEAGRALGLRPLQIFRHVVVMPALQTVFPALSSQFILVVLGSSVISTISAEELTAVANNLQSQSFRPFEIYFAVGGIYIALALGFEVIFSLIQRALFPPAEARAGMG